MDFVIARIARRDERYAPWSKGFRKQNGSRGSAGHCVIPGTLRGELDGRRTRSAAQRMDAAQAVANGRTYRGGGGGRFGARRLWRLDARGGGCATEAARGGTHPAAPVE